MGSFLPKRGAFVTAQDFQKYFFQSVKSLTKYPPTGPVLPLPPLLDF
jgi:hypothetical protein